MQAQTRAIIAASAFALVTHRKVAGLYDHGAGRHLRIAAEARGEHLQGYDGDHDVRFGGTLPELQAGGASVHMRIDGEVVQGFDRQSSRHFTANVRERVVQLYDHVAAAWFAFDVLTV